MAEGSSMPQWKGLFDWSMSYQDGTRPSDISKFQADPEKVKWLEEVLKNYMVDFSKRMEDMQSELQQHAKEDATSESVSQAEHLLDELNEIVESIDFARDLRSINGLPSLKALLQCSHASLRHRAAEVVATCCQNNLPVQVWFVEEHTLPLVVELLAAEEEAERLKGLLAVSCIIRGNPGGLEEFFNSLDGMKRLVPRINDEKPRVARKALELCKSIFAECAHLRPALAASPGFLAALADSLRSSEDLVRGSALRVLAELVDSQSTLQAVEADGGVVGAFAAAKERVDNACKDEPEACADEQLCVAVIGVALGGAAGE